MTLKSKILATSLVFSLGIITPSTYAVASGGGCWTSFVNWIANLCGRVDNVLDEVDEGLESFQKTIGRFTRIMNVATIVGGLKETEHVVRIQKNVNILNEGIDSIQSLIKGVDFEDGLSFFEDGLSFKEVRAAVASILGGIKALQKSGLIREEHILGINKGLKNTKDRLKDLDGLWNMANFIRMTYKSVDHYFKEKKSELNIKLACKVSKRLDEEIEV